MAFRVTDVGVQIMMSPKAAKRTFLDLMKEVDGNTSELAKHQGVSPSTVKRWMTRLEAAGQVVRRPVEKMREKAAKERAAAAE